MKNAPTRRLYKNADEMDKALERADFSRDILARGVVRLVPKKKINLDLPTFVIGQNDRIADRIGVSRQPLIKMWIHERLSSERARVNQRG
mgnify:CR=1 FL=1